MRVAKRNNSLARCGFGKEAWAELIDAKPLSGAFDFARGRSHLASAAGGRSPTKVNT
jgi:hypothetical protein